MYVEKTPHGFNIIGMPDDLFKGCLKAIKTHITSLANGNSKTKTKLNNLRRTMENELR
jgi:hypothetical protein